MQNLTEFLKNSYTAYQAVDNAKTLLKANGFVPLSETEDWTLEEGGKYFVERGGSALIAFTVDGLDDFCFRIVASHTDSPALKLKENPARASGVYTTLNVEKYGGGIFYSYFDRPLKLAGRIVYEENGIVKTQTVVSEKNFVIPSLAVHMNRGVNEGFAINPQIDLQPLLSLSGEGENWLTAVTDKKAISYDLYLVNAETPYFFGLNDEFLAAPRIDDLTGVYASLQALLSHARSGGVCVAACFDSEEIGSTTLTGAGGDLLEILLKRIAYAFKFDENEYYKALASSFLFSLDNAHGVHPNHPEKSDPTNKTTLGGGIVIKAHADKAYVTDALSSAVAKTVFDRAGVKYQTFFNRSDVRSGSTLGRISLEHVGVNGVDIGLAQLAMHSSIECFAKSDYTELINGLTAYYSSEILFSSEGVKIK